MLEGDESDPFSAPCLSTCRSLARDSPPKDSCVNATGRRCARPARRLWAAHTRSASDALAQHCTCVADCAPLSASTGRVARRTEGTSPPLEGPPLLSSPCWAVVGVLSVVNRAGRETRALIRSSYMRLAGAEGVCTRFVLGRQPSRRVGPKEAQLRHAAEVEASVHGDVVWLDARDDECGSKSLAWFRHASQRGTFPSAAFIGKADEDTFIRIDLLQRDLRLLRHSSPADRTAIGQFAWVHWEAEPSDKAPGRPCGQVQQLHDRVPRALGDQARSLSRRALGQVHQAAPRDCNASATGPYPFGVGPLYLFSARLARDVFGSALAGAFSSDRAVRCRAEDATIGFLVHSVSKLHGWEYVLAHMTWSKMHNFDVVPTYCSGPPGAETVAIHELKARRYGRKRVATLWAQIWQAAATDRARPCWPLIRFLWDPVHHTIRALEPEDAILWWLNHRRCKWSTGFCRAPPLLGAQHWAPNGTGWSSLPPRRSRRDRTSAQRS